MSRQSWSESVYVAVADGVAVSNSSTETILIPDVTIPANYMADGRTIRVRVFGKYSSSGTPTMTFAHRWGGVSGTLIAKTAACTVAANIANAPFEIDTIITTRSNGASGTLMGNGVARVHSGIAGTVASATGEGLVTPLTNGGATAPAAATCTLNADTAFSTTLIWSAASANNSATVVNYLIESLN